jgi:hypothetical protein
LELTKLAKRSERGRFMGRVPGTKGWRVLIETGSVVIRYDCIFVEGSTVEDSDTANSDPDSNTADEDEDANDANNPEEERQPKRTLPPRMRKPSKRLRDAYAMMCQVYTSRDEAATLQEALAQKDGALWQQAADDESAACVSLVEKPTGVRLLQSKWVLKITGTHSGNIERHKARLVAKGFTQREGIDFDETFASGARHATTRALLAKAAVEDLAVEQVDVKTALLNGPLKEEIYMQPPAGYNFGDKVLLLHKALHGLKQATRAWIDELKRFLHAENIIVSGADAALFCLERERPRCFLLIYADDGLIVCARDDVAVVLRALAHFDLRKLGPAAYFLGMEIIRDREAKTLMMSQRQYAHEILQRTGMKHCKGKATPMEQNLKLSKYGDDLMEDTGRYAETVGILLYLTTCTRPDMASAVGVLARFICKPRQERWVRVQGVLQYLKQTAECGIIYGLTDTPLEGYADSDLTADPDKRRSTGGNAFLVAGGAISWGSTLLPTVTSSTMEAEYMANGNAPKEALWLRRVMETLCGMAVSVQMYCDSAGALAQMHNPVGHQRAMRIDVLHHFLRERVARGEVKVEYIATEDMVADVLTKAVAKQQHEKCSKTMGMVSV